MMEHASELRELSLQRLLRAVSRGLRLRCPHCGAAPLFSSWLQIRPTCPNCGLRSDRGAEDYFIGGYLINLIVAELLVVGGLVGVVFATWPDVPWTLLTWGLIAFMIPAPFVTYPFAKALWLALDLHFQPATAADFVDVGAAERSFDSGLSS